MFKWITNLMDSNEKVLKHLQPAIFRINELEPEFQKLSDSELKGKTDEFRARLKDGATPDDLLAEAFAAVREAARRAIGQRHYDVQLMGGMVLHQGKIAEMKTGEGKTLVATLPLYLNALSGLGCHLVTVNDYLAKRDAHWMGAVYNPLGITVAAIYGPEHGHEIQPSSIYDPAFDSGNRSRAHLRPCTRRQAYQADITYGTNSEFGFDYLRDNMVLDLSQCAQRPLNFAIVDEVDNILIDEARTPLIISGSADESNEKRRKLLEEYKPFARIAASLKEGEDKDFKVDAKTKTVELTEEGDLKVDKLLKAAGLLKTETRHDLEHDAGNALVVHRIDNALKAHVIFKNDRDYIVDPKEGVVIIDEFTGRRMIGRRYSDGLHEAIEAKEGVYPRREILTLASVTIQNYFRMYKKLGGMTGTAATEAEEFFKIYKLEVVIVPTNRPMQRQDFGDQIYKDEEAKFRAVVREIDTLHGQERPVLVGTVSIEKSERLSDMLKKKGIKHEVLNAKLHEKEAAIISQAGRPGAVTVATNMAGRGVDIILGGLPPEKELAASEDEYKKARAAWDVEHQKVVGAGGLHIVGTERHEARRIDNQLRGRAGRQGDPGSSRFYISLEDDVIKRFGGDRIKGFMEWAGMDENTPIEAGVVSRAIENAQVRVEGYHFDMRKHLVEYDDVVNKHREVIYAERHKVLAGTDLKANILDMVEREVKRAVSRHWGDRLDPDVAGLYEHLSGVMPMPPAEVADRLSGMRAGETTEAMMSFARDLYEQREKDITPENMRMAERFVMLHVIDNLWKEHLTAMEDMRQGIGLHAVGQQDPLVAYKREGHALFSELLENIQHDVVNMIFRVNVQRQEESPAPRAEKPVERKPAPRLPAAMATAAPRRQPVATAVPSGHVGRNDPCPCGSGKKYKKCCGK